MDKSALGCCDSSTSFLSSGRGNGSVTAAELSILPTVAQAVQRDFELLHTEGRHQAGRQGRLKPINEQDADGERVVIVPTHSRRNSIIHADPQGNSGGAKQERNKSLIA